MCCNLQALLFFGVHMSVLQQARMCDLQDTETEALCHLDLHRKSGPVRQPDVLHHAQCVLAEAALWAYRLLHSVEYLGSLDLLEHSRCPAFLAYLPFGYIYK